MPLLLFNVKLYNITLLFQLQHTEWGNEYSIKPTPCSLTWEDKDEECTNATNNADDFADVWNKQSNEESDDDPHCSQGNSDAGLIRLSHSVPQKWNLNHQSVKYAVERLMHHYIGIDSDF